MADEQEVIIVGVDGSVPAWSKETTQNQIMTTLQKAGIQNAAIITLLTAVANGEKASASILENIKSSLHQEVKLDTQSGQADKASKAKDTVVQSKLTGHLSALLSLGKTGNSSLVENDRNAARRQKHTDALIDAGYDRNSASQAAESKMKVESAKKQAEKVSLMLLAVKGAMDTIKEATAVGYEERFDMAAEMRQSGLLSNLDSLSQEFVNVSNMISATSFTFGEAAEFTKRFSKAVGVTGVKSALEFSKAIANGDVETGTGYMQRFAMDFGQVANMSGQYLESLRVSGQLQGRDQTQLKSGMTAFMDNVQMTANVLKISMEEAAELMTKSLGADQAGLIATMAPERRNEAQALMENMNIQGSAIGDAIAARIGAGSQSSFMLTDEWDTLSNSILGLKSIDFANMVGAQFDTGEGNKKLFEWLANYMPKFKDEVVDIASQPGMHALIVADKTDAALLGSIAQMSQTFGSAANEIGGGGEASRTQIQSTELKRKAGVLAEHAMTRQMNAFTANLRQLTIEFDMLANQAHSSLLKYAPVLEKTTDLSAALEGGWAKLGKDIIDIFTKDDSGDVIRAMAYKQERLNKFLLDKAEHMVKYPDASFTQWDWDISWLTSSIENLSVKKDRLLAEEKVTALASEKNALVATPNLKEFTFGSIGNKLLETFDPGKLSNLYEEFAKLNKADQDAIISQNASNAAAIKSIIDSTVVTKENQPKLGELLLQLNKLIAINIKLNDALDR